MSEVRRAAEAARDAAQHVATLSTQQKNDYLRDLAGALVAAEGDILRANATDIAREPGSVSDQGTADQETALLFLHPGKGKWGSTSLAGPELTRKAGGHLGSSLGEAPGQGDRECEPLAAFSEGVGHGATPDQQKAQRLWKGRVRARIQHRGEHGWHQGHPGDPAGVQ